MFGDSAGASRWRPNMPPAGVGGGVGDEGGDEHVDEQRGAVVGQLAQQHRVRERDPDPDDREDA